MKKKKTAPRDRSTAAQSSAPPVPPPPAAKQPVKQVSPVTTDGFKAFILLIAVVFGLLMFFGLEPNKRWFNERIMSYWEDFKEQKLNLDLEERKLMRYQTDYLIAKNVTGFFEKRGVAGKVLVLMPPTDYLKANNLDVHVPEPAVFYYFTGLKTIWANSPEASKATWFVSAKNGVLVFDSVTNKQILLDTIAAYNKYKFL
jgi:hypothetical protein